MADDYITPAQNETRKLMKEMNDTLSKLLDSANLSAAKNLADYKDTHKEVNKEDTKTAEEVNDQIVDAFEKAKNNMKSAGEILSEKLLSSITAGLGKISSQFGGMLQEYTNMQQKISFGLIGSGVTYDTIKTALSAIGTNAFIKQNDVYKNLATLINEGITMNAAQRAYLTTAAQNVGLNFSATEQSLNRLIQLQQADLTEARLAQMAGLKEFLEQNYKNSQYIKQGFESVSAALVEMQSLMTAQMAMSTEKAIQTYLGAFQSAGGSKSSNIATAIGQIGSGDFSLDNGMQNLMVMAASRAGLSYSDLLTGGLTPAKSEALLASLFNYLASLSSVGGGSNVALNAIAKVFGVSVSDIKAAQNMNVGTGLNTGWNSNISGFFSNYINSTPTALQTDNLWNNLISNEALVTNMTITSWNLLNELSTMVGGTLQEVSKTLPWGTGVIPSLLGAGVSNLPTLTVLGSIMAKEGNLTNLFSLGTLKDVATNGLGSFADTLLARLFPEAALSGQFINDYNLLGDNWTDGSLQYTSSGAFSSRGRGASKSGKITTGKSRNEVKIEEGEAPEEKTLTDLYNLLADDFPVTTFETSIIEGGNDVFIGNAQTTQYITDMLTITAVSTENILMLLENVFAGGTRSLINTSSIKLQNSWGDLFGSASR